MQLLLFLFALGALSLSDGNPVQHQNGTCDTFWFKFNNRFFKYVATEMTWADAELHCVSLGANLVSIHSLEEHEYVKSLIKTFDPTLGRTWIGLSDIHKEGSWMWSDGSPARFFYWLPVEPNNKDGREHCAECNFIETLKWNDSNCSRKAPSVCATPKSR